MLSFTSRRRPGLPHALRCLPALVLLALALPAQAQWLGAAPQVRLQPAFPARPLVDPIGRALAAPLQGGLRGESIDLLAKRLLRRHPDVVAQDPAGAAIVRDEVVAIDPTAEVLEAARGAGYGIGEARNLDGLGLRIVVLHAPPGMEAAAALARLRSIAPTGSFDFNHLYFGSGSLSSARAIEGRASATEAVRIGLVDSGVDAGHPALRDTDVHAWGCNGRAVPGGHGTAIASLLHAGTLYSADIYCGEPAGGSATAFAAALAWLASERVPVINISLVGPDNLLLRRATESMLAKGYVLVAAVGNDGPAAAPLFPAAYPGVIGVTAVDAHRRALPEALRGPQVDFAAVGSGLRAAVPGRGWSKVRGTSFAVPAVARVAAVLLEVPDAARAAAIRDQLAGGTIDLGDAGRDDTYGFGLVR